MIPRELLKEVRRIEALTTRRVNDSMAGQYHSVFKGRGMDFDEVRPYREGDDVRSIDWNVSARMPCGIVFAATTWRTLKTKTKQYD